MADATMAKAVHGPYIAVTIGHPPGNGSLAPPSRMGFQLIVETGW
jgi:hypothetical protein